MSIKLRYFNNTYYPYRVFCKHAEVTVGFTMPSYNVQESDGSLEVCVSLTGDTAIPVRITFSAIDGTATGRHVFCFCISVFCTIIFGYTHPPTHAYSQNYYQKTFFQQIMISGYLQRILYSLVMALEMSALTFRF